MVNDQIILLLAAITAAFALTVFAWDVEAERLKRENARLRRHLQSVLDFPNGGTVNDMLAVVEASKPAGADTRAVLEELLARVSPPREEQDQERRRDVVASR